MQEVYEQLQLERSFELFSRAEKLIPGGVNSPVRAYKAVGGTPPFIKKAEGAHVYDEDGNRYIDFVGSWGPMILGHAHPAVVQVVQQAAANSLSFGAPCELEVQLAAEVCRRYDSIDKVRFVNSGTEATMTAIRLARGFTGRAKIIKFEGCYHGHSDALLVKAGSGALTFGVPSSPGVTTGCTQDTLTATYNDLDSVEALFDAHGDDVAAIILEPIPGNMNMLLPKDGFLEGLRELCDRYNSVLIFDEVMSGFRVAPQGVQSLTAVKPDLTTLGKIIGGGMPVGAFGGRVDIMDCLAPLGPVYQAGTLSGNPLAMAAGLETLQHLNDTSYETLKARTQQLVEGILVAAKDAGVAMCANYRPGMFGLFFTEQDQVDCYEKVMACNTEHFNHFFNGMLARGVYLAPSAFEASFVSLAHDEAAIEETIRASREVLQGLNRN